MRNEVCSIINILKYFNIINKQFVYRIAIFLKILTSCFIRFKKFWRALCFVNLIVLLFPVTGFREISKLRCCHHSLAFLPS